MDKPCTKEENAELFRRIIEGDEEARERFIKGNMAYVIAAVDGFVRERHQYKYLQDDLISEGYLVLARISQSIRNTQNPQGMLASCLINAFNKLTSNETKEITEALDNNLIAENNRDKGSRYEVLAGCENNLERRIMSLHLDGHTDRKIAHTLNMTRPHILRIRQKINKKLQR